MKGMNKILEQAQKMQEGLQQAQEKLAKLEVVGEAGGSLVKVTMTGQHDVKRVDIADELFSNDKDMLEDLLAAAINDAVRRIEAANSEQMSDLTGGINLPPGMKLPF